MLLLWVSDGRFDDICDSDEVELGGISTAVLADAILGSCLWESELDLS